MIPFVAGLASKIPLGWMKWIKLGLLAAVLVTPLITYGCGKSKGRELAENAFAAKALEDFEKVTQLRDALKAAERKANEAHLAKKATDLVAAKELKDGVHESVEANPTDPTICRVPAAEHGMLRDYAEQANGPRKR